MKHTGMLVTLLAPPGLRLAAMQSRATISKETAKYCLEAAGAAYHEDDQSFSYEAQGCKVCFTMEADRAIIAFRGTHNIENFCTDLDIKLIPYLPGRGHVHKGFFEAFQALQPILDDVLEALQPGKLLLFTGLVGYRMKRAPMKSPPTPIPKKDASELVWVVMRFKFILLRNWCGAGADFFGKLWRSRW
eukprot:s329_g24.t1